MPTRRSFLFHAVAGAMLHAVPGVIRPVAAEPGDGPAAPPFAGINGWLNTDTPLTTAALRGRIVLVDFWTYSCINCRRTVPYLNRWQGEYGPHGLQVVGIHTPEFGFERMRVNVAEAVRAFGIRYPVGQDNNFETWRAWNNRAWPSFYLVDRDGRIVLRREGEGHARELETAIRALLGLPPSRLIGQPGDDPDLSRVGTGEIYFGADHPSRQDRRQAPRPGQTSYSFRGDPLPGYYQLNDAWNRGGEALVLRSPAGGLRVRFTAAKLHLVASAPTPVTLTVTADGVAAGTVEIGRPTLYTLLDGEDYGEHTLSFVADAPGLELYSITFG